MPLRRTTTVAGPAAARPHPSSPRRTIGVVGCGGWGPRAASPATSRGSQSRASRAHFVGLHSFSLVELVIAIAILSVGLVGALRVFPVGLRASQRSELNSRTAIVAQRTLESLKLKPWSLLPDGEAAADVEGMRVTTRIRSLTLPPLTDPQRLKALDVVVQSVQEGRPRTLTVTTYVRRPPQ